MVSLHRSSYGCTWEVAKHSRGASCDCCAFLVLIASPEHPNHEPIINLATISLLLSKIWRFPPPRMLGNHDNLAET